MHGSSGARRVSAVLARGACLAGHVLLAALCLELAARLDDRLSYEAPLIAPYDADAIRTRDGDGLVRNLPGARFEKWRINQLGFRGPTVALHKPDGRRRVACLGTSESFGLYEREGEEWPAQLGRRLAASGADAEVINAAVVGLRRDTHLRYFDRYVQPLRPDVVVLYLNVIEEATYRTPPAGEAAPAATAGGPVPTGWLPPVSWSSRALPKLQRAARAALPKGLWARLRQARLEREVGRGEQTLGDHPPLDAVPAEAVTAFESHLRRLVVGLQARGVAPVLATYPTLGTGSNREEHRLEFLEERIWYFELSDLGLVDAAARLNDAVRRVAREMAVPLADADAAVPKTAEFFADYVHYTDAGAALVAAAVQGALEGGGLLGPR
jgi:lysophospholipase L1-like esterase